MDNLVIAAFAAVGFIVSGVIVFLIAREVFKFFARLCEMSEDLEIVVKCLVTLGVLRSKERFFTDDKLGLEGFMIERIRDCALAYKEKRK